MPNQDKASVDTGPLKNAAASYESVATSVRTVMNGYVTGSENLRGACGDDDTGQKMFTQINGIQHDLLKFTRLLADVTDLTGKGILDMRDAYEQAETNAELLARGSDPNLHDGPARPHTQNPGGNNNTPNTDTSSGSGRNKH